MNEHLTANPAEAQRYRDRFLDTMEFIRHAFPRGFRRTARGKATPHARFEAIAVGSYLALQARPALATEQPIRVAEWVTGDEFKKVVGSDGANVRKKLIARLEFVRDRLLEA
jgi:hypothetical protein